MHLVLHNPLVIYNQSSNPHLKRLKLKVNNATTDRIDCVVL